MVFKLSCKYNVEKKYVVFIQVQEMHLIFFFAGFQCNFHLYLLHGMNEDVIEIL